MFCRSNMAYIELPLFHSWNKKVPVELLDNRFWKQNASLSLPICLSLSPALKLEILCYWYSSVEVNPFFRLADYCYVIIIKNILTVKRYFYLCLPLFYSSLSLLASLLRVYLYASVSALCYVVAGKWKIHSCQRNRKPIKPRNTNPAPR